MIYLELFWVFLITNLLGYGGGPAIIPLVQREVVATYGWITEARFAEVLAMGNAIPGPIAPKMAAYIGFSQGGVLGAIVALFATIAPSLILMLILMSILRKHKDSPPVKKISRYVRPTIAALLLIITVQNTILSLGAIPVVHFLVLSVVSLVLLAKLKIHPAFVVAGALIYGAVFLGY